jgi:hypothetical protein
MQAKDIHTVIRTVKREIARWPEPVVGVVARQSGRDPFLVLISCLLSLRTKDKTTGEASRRLFTLASTPVEMQKLSAAAIEQAIYPVGFYRTKAKQIQQICSQLIERYGGRVPDDIDELLMRQTWWSRLGIRSRGFVSTSTCIESATGGAMWRRRILTKPSRRSEKNSHANIGSFSTTCSCPTASTFVSPYHRCAVSANSPLLVIRLG